MDGTEYGIHLYIFYDIQCWEQVVFKNTEIICQTKMFYNFTFSNNKIIIYNTLLFSNYILSSYMCCLLNSYLKQIYKTKRSTFIDKNKLLKLGSIS